MLDLASLYLDKAQESLAGAESEFGSRRYNNCANRSYYACFQAAIAALLRAGIQPAGSSASWSHRFVAAQFDGVLVNRRKLYPADVRQSIARNHVARLQADYDEGPLTQTEAQRALRRCQALVTAVSTEGGGSR